ncbi:MAG TPA: sugar ABC transporter permease, partial [Rhodothermia bacterium]|nr:sugar ABC transporter permease [Rhodothermia bacterium]
MSRQEHQGGEGRRKRRSNWPGALLFLSPTLVIFTVFIAFPILFSFYLSFHEWNMFSGDRHFVGMENYAAMFSDPEFWHVFKTTTIYTLGTVPLNMMIALWVASVLNKKIIGKKFLRAAFFTPVIVSSVAAAVIWRWVFDPNLGLLNFALEGVGLPPVNWINDATAAMIALMIVGVWKTFGVNMILFSAGLSGIPEHYYEAAEIDGAGGWDKFYNITLPLL